MRVCVYINIYIYILCAEFVEMWKERVINSVYVVRAQRSYYEEKKLTNSRGVRNILSGSIIVFRVV